MLLWAYAIVRDEEGNVPGMVETALKPGGADGLLVLDTGSRDGTVAALREAAAQYPGKTLVVAEGSVRPWRFDVARNAALALVPDDVDWVAVLDADWRCEDGWGDAIRTVSKEHPSATRVDYTYVYTHLPDGSNGTLSKLAWTHRRHGYRWDGIIHETPRWCGNGQELAVNAPGYVVHHWPVETPSRRASQDAYLPRLEAAVKESPATPRLWTYLGRQHWTARQYDSYLATLQHYIEMGGSHVAERAEAMRIIAACSDGRAAKWRWLMRAGVECFGRRDHWVDLAKLSLQHSEHAQALWAAQIALAITDRTGGGLYSNSQYWGGDVYDYAAVAAWHLGAHDLARGYAAMAVEMAPGDSRIAKNAAKMGVGGEEASEPATPATPPHVPGNAAPAPKPRRRSRKEDAPDA
jgi:hypothetical protein